MPPIVMTQLSESDIIASNPIGDGLDRFRSLFRSMLKDLSISELQDVSAQVVHLTEVANAGKTKNLCTSTFRLIYIDARTLALGLVITLQALPAARFFQSPSGRGALDSSLAVFYSRLSRDDIDIGSIIPLLEQVIKLAPDLDIWNAAFELVAEPRTPPTVLNSSVHDTPVKSNSGSQQGSEQDHSDIDNRMLQEVSGCVYNNTKGFYEKYFEGRSWSSATERIVREADPQIAGDYWADYPNPPSQDVFLEWFFEFQSKFFLERRGTFYSSSSSPLGGSDCKRKPDIFLALSNTAKRNGQYIWQDVRIIGELKQSISRKYRDEFKKFCGYAREVFTSQPTRLFLHGFVIRGSIMELWVFDRSGPYNRDTFDIRKDPNRFIIVMAGYTMMSDEELGLNTYIKEDEHGKYIMFKAEDKTKEEKLCLEDKPIALQHAIVCRGTTCYRAKRPDAEDWEFVVKFSWRSDKRRAEGELLKLARERGVWGVARLFGYQDLDSIANLRQGLQFGKPRWFSKDNSGSASQTLSRTKSTSSKKSQLRSSILADGRVTELSSSGQKRKRYGKADELRQSKRSRSGSSGILADITSQTNQVTTEQSGSAEGANKCSIEKPKATSLMPPKGVDDESFDNRIFSCLVVSPPGRPIHEFKSVLEFLKACRDVIKGHRSLYQDGKILHRDVSKNNIIITDAKKEEDPSGMLIDLDLARESGGGPSGARHQTGTMEFMAIEVLEGRAHTYRHDLESFFYVFLWVIIRHGWRTSDDLPVESRLQEWYTGTYGRIAGAKRGVMDKIGFKSIIAEFPLQFEGVKHLAEELRRILFPIRDEALFTGTYSEPKWVDSMYDGMINAFNGAIGTYQRRYA
ncbi:MAG: hypothetical protein M1840_008121 [Geoglossum simile]|nr:MAG: hypothetical protein M1840_008121 [Geoglossum simile]